jgi:hypothetical protein
MLNKLLKTTSSWQRTNPDEILLLLCSTAKKIASSDTTTCSIYSFIVVVGVVNTRICGGFDQGGELKVVLSTGMRKHRDCDDQRKDEGKTS